MVALDELADDAEAFERAGAVRCMHELQESASGYADAHSGTLGNPTVAIRYSRTARAQGDGRGSSKNRARL